MIDMKPGKNGFSEPTDDYWMRHALNVIHKQYGHEVSVYNKSKDLLKFGRNELVGTAEATIQHQPAGILHESFVSSNLINTIISTNVNDGEVVVVEGHTISGGVFTFVTQSVTLNGRTAVALGTALARVSRCYNDDSTELQGVISITETDTYASGVPATPAKVHLQMGEGEQNSEKAATTLEDGNYWIVQGFYGDVLEKTSAFAEIHFECRLPGKVFVDLLMKSAGTSHHAMQKFKPYLIIPPNSDIRLTAVADGANTDVSGGIQGVLATVVT